jgi:flagellar biosynthetic protein FliR
VRCTGLFVVAPIFGRRNIPAYFKIGFSFFIALIIINTLPNVNYLIEIDTVFGFVALVFKEFVVGIIIGYVGYIIFASIYIAGQLVDMQIGFGVINVLDPITNAQVPVTSNFYYTVTMLIFLMSNGHHLVIRALYQSYTLVPLGQATFNATLMNNGLRVFGDIFIIALKISAPIIAAIFIADIALGIISKTVPQLNIFIVGMPLKIAMGLIILAITVPSFSIMVDFLIKGMDIEMYEFLKAMGGIK